MATAPSMAASRTRAKKAGPDAHRAVDASMCRVGSGVVERGVGGCNDGHGFADNGSGVAHGTDNAASAILLGILAGHSAVESDLDILNSDTSTDTDKELAVQSL
ncbi:hypothetical protein HG531_004171 [Fusarium graminearum]|nr:hypothetical protein HG531_004171 [Fusarium graminearum]